jgi:nucleoside-diphosphate-sugar epimerase
MLLITGATGFVGSALCAQLVAQGRQVSRVVRRASHPFDGHATHVTPCIDGNVDWSKALSGINSIIHLAARVHLLDDQASDPLTEYRKVNVQGTINLARQAAQSGVGRFVFVSSVKVNGESTRLNRPFTADDIPAPENPYSVSKFEAEQELLHMATEVDMEIVIVRPPLVYGPGVKANFERMIRWVSTGLPLPFGAITQNRRSLVALDNLVDLLIRCVDHPNAGGRIFMVSDGEDLSTKELLFRLGNAMKRQVRLVSIPVCILDMSTKLIGKHKVAERLLGSLQVDIGDTCRLLDWSPAVGVDEALRRAVTGRSI